MNYKELIAQRKQIDSILASNEFHKIIYEQRKTQSLREIGDQYGLSFQRIHQIVKNYEKKYGQQ